MNLLVCSLNENAVLTVENLACLPPLSEERPHGKISREINVDLLF